MAVLLLGLVLHLLVPFVKNTGSMQQAAQRAEFSRCCMHKNMLCAEVCSLCLACNIASLTFVNVKENFMQCQGGYGGGGGGIEGRQPGQGGGENVGNLQQQQYQGRGQQQQGGGETHGNIQSPGGTGGEQQYPQPSGQLTIGQGRPPVNVGGYGTVPPPTVYPVPPLPQQYGGGQTSNIEIPPLPRQPQYPSTGQRQQQHEIDEPKGENFQNQQLSPASSYQPQIQQPIQLRPGSNENQQQQRYKPPEIGGPGLGEGGFRPNTGEIGRPPSSESLQQHGRGGFERSGGFVSRQAPSEGYNTPKSAALTSGGMQPSVNPENFQNQVQNRFQQPATFQPSPQQQYGEKGANLGEQKVGEFEKNFHGNRGGGGDFFNDQPQSDINQGAKGKSAVPDVDGDNGNECPMQSVDSNQKCVWKFQEKHHLNLWPSNMFASICESLVKNVESCKRMCESESECRSVHFCRNCVGHNCRLMSEKENGKGGLKLIQEFEFVDYYEKVDC